MYNYKLIIHDDNFTWCLTCCSDQLGPIHMIESEFAKEGVQIHEYQNGNLYLTMKGKRCEYYEG